MRPASLPRCGPGWQSGWDCRPKSWNGRAAIPSCPKRPARRAPKAVEAAKPFGGGGRDKEKKKDGFFPHPPNEKLRLGLHGVPEVYGAGGRDYFFAPPQALVGGGAQCGRGLGPAGAMCR